MSFPNFEVGAHVGMVIAIAKSWRLQSARPNRSFTRPIKHVFCRLNAAWIAERALLEGSVFKP